MAGVVENKIARATTMLTNGADELRSSVGKARGSLARGRVSASDSALLSATEPEEGVLKVVP
jgi:hypothetical protein